jgi:GTP-binding protein EngB required for normal cell division
MNLDNLDFTSVIETAVNKAKGEIGHATILIAGKTGVGKSTLINAVFREDLAATGDGRPVTRNAREISKKGFPLSIIDTRGFETGETALQTIEEIQDLVKTRNREKDHNRHIHVAWLCILEDTRRIEDSERNFVAMLDDLGIPTIAVITQAKTDDDFATVVLSELPQLRNAIKVLAQDFHLIGNIRLPAYNLDTLIELTISVAPEGQEMAITAANRVNISQKLKKSQAVVGAAVTTATAMAAIPGPVDLFTILPTQMGMLATLSRIWGLPVSVSSLITLVTGSIGGATGVALRRLIVGEFIEFIPGGGYSSRNGN